MRHLQGFPDPCAMWWSTMGWILRQTNTGLEVVRSMALTKCHSARYGGTHGDAEQHDQLTS